jgi:hypothetical protein
LIAQAERADQGHRKGLNTAQPQPADRVLEARIGLYALVQRETGGLG